MFNKKPTAPQTQVANNQGGNNANGAANQGNTNLLAIKFDEAKAQQYLKSKTISQKEYNIWKAFGIAPIYQKRYPKETQTQIAQILKETKKQQGGQQQASQQKGVQQKAGQQNGKQNVQQQPQQVAKQGNVQPAQQGGQSNAKNNDYYSKTTQNGVTTTVSGGTVSYINLPPDEKKVYDDAEKKAIENYIKKGNSEWNARRKASMNANVAVIRYRQRKAKKTS